MRIPKPKRLAKPSVGEDEEELEISCAAGDHVKCYNHFAKESVSFFKC